MLFPAPLAARATHRLQAVSRADRGVDQRADLGVRAAARRQSPAVAASRGQPVGAVLDAQPAPARRRARAVVVASEHGACRRAKRNRWSIAAFGFIGAALVSGLVVHRRELLDTTGIGEFFIAVAHVLAQPPASIGLWPFHSSSRRRSRARSPSGGARSCRRLPCMGRSRVLGAAQRTRRSRTRRSKRRRSARAAWRRSARAARSWCRSPRSPRRRRFASRRWVIRRSRSSGRTCCACGARRSSDCSSVRRGWPSRSARRCRAARATSRSG